MKPNELGIYEWGLEERRAMIGREFALLKPMVVTNGQGEQMECLAGAPCKVSHLVDYGEGLLVFVNAAGREFNQFDKKEFSKYLKEKTNLKLVG